MNKKIELSLHALKGLIASAILSALLGGCPTPGGDTKDTKKATSLVQTASFTGSVLTLQFNEAIKDPDKTKITVQKAEEGSKKFTSVTAFAADINTTYKTKLEITLTVAPASGQKYKVTLKEGAVLNIAGNPNSPVSTQELSITTLPELKAFNPFSQVDSVLTLQFNEAIKDPDKTRITVQKAEKDSGTFTSVTAFAVAINTRDKTKLEITLTAVPTEGQKYKVTLQRGAVLNTAGDPNAAPGTQELTVTALPELKAFNRVGKVLALKFNKAIENPVKAKITVQKAEKDSEAFTSVTTFTAAVNTSDASRLEITLTTNPTPGQKYKVALEAEAVRDLAGKFNAIISTTELTISAGPVLKTAPSLSTADTSKLIVKFKADLARTVNSKIKVHKNKSALSTGYTVAINITDRKKLEITLALPAKLGDTYQVKFQAAAVFDTQDSGNVAQDTNEVAINWTDNTAIWSGRRSHTSVVFKDKVWVLGGHDYDYRNDVWSSPDTITWTQETSAAPWSGRAAHTSVVFKDKVWILGGYDDGYTNDVWSSPDGKAWTQETSAAPWSGRAAHTSVVFDSKIWVLGGGNRNNDVWSSPDGKAWTQVTEAAPWPSRRGHSSVVFKDKIWVLGGSKSSKESLNDVWNSSDGENWTRITANTEWPVRYEHTSVVFKDKIWVLGGYDRFRKVRKSDVWSSSDGKSWTRLPASIAWPARYEHTSVVFKDKIWVLGGWKGSDGTNKNDVWSFFDSKE